MSDCYIGRKTCGCVVAVVVIEGDRPDDVKWKREVAKNVAKWIRQGLSIERVPVEVARTVLTFDCAHDKKPKAKQETLALGSAHA